MIDKFLQRVLVQDTVGKLFFGGRAQASATASLSDWRVYSPWFLGSAALIGCPSERDGRHLLRSLKPFLEKSTFKFSGTAVKLWAAVQKPKEERICNRRLEGHFDCKAQLWRMVYWRTATVIVASRRVATQRRDLGDAQVTSTDLLWHEGWWQLTDYSIPPDQLRNEALCAMAEL